MSFQFKLQARGPLVKKKDRWPELCELVAQDDGLVVRDSGPWAEKKLHFWNAYIDITTSSMVGHVGWPEGVVYVDLFAGPGVCLISGANRRVPGSPLIAAHAPKAFRKILLCELDPVNAIACQDRLNRSPAAATSKVFCGDCNDEVSKIAAEIPRGALTLAFIDPTGLHIKMTTITKLASAGRVDLLILFPDAVDVLRNIDLYRLQPNSNLDQFLGSDSNWRAELDSLGDSEPSRVRQLFATLYTQQLKKHAKYEVFGQEIIKGPQGPLYRLIFASKHPRGAEFWEKVTKKELGGQRRFHFD
jgi:three-Cys-motif partner protein